MVSGYQDGMTSEVVFFWILNEANSFFYWKHVTEWSYTPSKERESQAWGPCVLAAAPASPHPDGDRCGSGWRRGSLLYCCSYASSFSSASCTLGCVPVTATLYRPLRVITFTFWGWICLLSGINLPFVFVFTVLLLKVAHCIICFLCFFPVWI